MPTVSASPTEIGEQPVWGTGQESPTKSPSDPITNGIDIEQNAAILHGQFTVGQCEYSAIIHADTVDYGGPIIGNMFYVIRKFYPTEKRFFSGATFGRLHF
jgi:hypothetical protein